MVSENSLKGTIGGGVGQSVISYQKETEQMETMKNGKKALIELENKLDEEIAKLEFLSLPRRTVLSGLWWMFDRLINDRVNSNCFGNCSAQKGEALMSRFSYIVDLLLKSPLEPLGEDAFNAMEPLMINSSKFAEEMGLLFQYATLCELMPEVHRDYYYVSGNCRTKFVLNHISPKAAAYECRDIILTEIARSIVLRTNLDFCTQDMNIDSFVLCVREMYNHIMRLPAENLVLSDEGICAAVGLTSKEFMAYRSACIAFAECCRFNADRHANNMLCDVFNESEFGEYLEWINVCIKSEWFLKVICEISELSLPTVQRATDCFSVSHHPSKKRNAGDGFFPPFWWLSEECIMFNPDIVIRMLSSRNVVYAVNRTNSERFHAQVSGHLESTLIDEMKRAIDGLDISVIENRKWDKGEFDLLAFEPKTNTVVHVQAKAGILVQGARMVGALEEQSRIAIKQLLRFRDLSQSDKNRVLTEIFGRDIREPKVLDVLLTRGGIGSWKVWEELGEVEVIPANPALIKLARSCGADSLMDLVHSLPSVLDEIVSKAAGSWDVASLHLTDASIEFPSLNWNHDYLSQIHRSVLDIK